MGLNFNHSDARWSYEGFDRFRKRLATRIGINLYDMQGFSSPTGKSLSWDDVFDPIKLLLNHSDCSGNLSPVECAVVAPRLRQLIEEWDDDRDKKHALMLVEGMEYCVMNGEVLIFC